MWLCNLQIQRGEYFVLILRIMMDQVQPLTRFNFPQCLEVLSRLEYPLLGQGVAGVKQ